MRQLEDLEINALEMLMEILERQISFGKPIYKDTLLEVSLDDLKNYRFKYNSGEDMRFYEVFEILRKRDCGLIDFKANDPDRIQWEFDSRNSEERAGQILTPAYVITVKKSFLADAQQCIDDIKTKSTIKAGQIHIYWDPQRYRISRAVTDGLKPYEIKRSKQKIDKRRVVISEIFKKHPNKISIEELLQATDSDLEKFKGLISKFNATLGIKLNATERRLILNDDDWTELFLNQTDFYIDS